MPREKTPLPDTGDLALSVDLADWQRASEVLGRIVERMGFCMPPFGDGRSAELSERIQQADALKRRLDDIWVRVIRPKLTKWEGAESPVL